MLCPVPQAETKVEALARSTRKILAEKKKLEKVATSVQQESEELQEQQGWDWEEIASLKAELAQLRCELEMARASAAEPANPAVRQLRNHHDPSFCPSFLHPFPPAPSSRCRIAWSTSRCSILR